MRSITRYSFVLLLLCLMFVPVTGQTTALNVDLAKQPTLYVVAYSHLDTQWRWEYPQVINDYIPKTMHDNFALIDKYPNYIFNFSGANRYGMMKEYWPADYLRVKQYVAAGRWFPAGSSMEESDVNVPSAESIFRQILYGNQFFRREFGRTSAEYMLPDCFGFPASLPSILAHSGIKGFSTQKLTWNSAFNGGGPGSIEATPRGIPWNVGLWKGLDGRGVIAALNPGSYGGQIREDISKSPIARGNVVDWPTRVQRNGTVSGLFTDYHYYGTGDTGGAPREDSVRMVEAIVSKNPSIMPPQQQSATVGDGPLKIVSATAEQMFLNIQPGQVKGLPVYQGDLLLTDHSAGSITSQTYQKRWNRKNELLADAAEKASVGAAWLGSRTYPVERLNRAWRLVMGGQFHDILPGTATPRSFQFSWNDDVIAMNQFAGVLTSATEAIVAEMNTQTVGSAVVVYNPLNIGREDVVEAEVELGNAKTVKVVGPDGREVPSQISGKKVLFLANVPSIGYAVYDVQLQDVASALIRRGVPLRAPFSFPTANKLTQARAATEGRPYELGHYQDVSGRDERASNQIGNRKSAIKNPPQPVVSSAQPTLKVTGSMLANQRYAIELDQRGDVASIVDKKLNRELLSTPIRLAFKTDKPRQWPAWNMDWSDVQKAPRAYVDGPVKVRIVEDGPVRVALEITREAEGSKFIQTVRLSAGDAGNRVEFGNVIEWRSSETNLKATFPLRAANSLATYNWDIGTIQRGNNDERKFEVPSHQWFDLTDQSGTFGVTILSDCKYGSDKPNDSTLQLTLLRTPGISPRAGYADQSTQDWGRHEFFYGLASHAGDLRREQTDWQAQRLNQPLIAFRTAKHPGSLGRSFSILRLNNDRVRVLALKKAEESDEVIVRIVELDGNSAPNVRLLFASPVLSAREVNGQELPVGSAKVIAGQLATNLDRFQPRTFAVKLAPRSFAPGSPQSNQLNLAYDLAGATSDGEKSTAGFDGTGLSLPAEMLPEYLPFAGVGFQLAPAGSGKLNVVSSRGQVIRLPQNVRRVYLLAASIGEDQPVTFGVGNTQVPLTIQSWSGFVGQWDTRIWKRTEVKVQPRAIPAEIPADIASILQRSRTRVDPYGEMSGLTPGFIKRAPIAWYASHRHTADGENEAYAYSYLFGYVIDVPAGAKSLTLPVNDKVRILAITTSNERYTVAPAQPLYDTLER